MALLKLVHRILGGSAVPRLPCGQKMWHLLNSGCIASISHQRYDAGVTSEEEEEEEEERELRA